MAAMLDVPDAWGKINGDAVLASTCEGMHCSPGETR